MAVKWKHVRNTAVAVLAVAGWSAIRDNSEVTGHSTGKTIQDGGEVVKRGSIFLYRLIGNLANGEDSTTPAVAAENVGSTAVSGSITLQIAPLGVECDEPLISVIARKDDYAILIAEQIVDQNKVPFITNPQAYRIVAAADASNREKTIYPDDTVEVCPEPEPVPVPHS